MEISRNCTISQLSILYQFLIPTNKMLLLWQFVFFQHINFAIKCNKYLWGSLTVRLLALPKHSETPQVAFPKVQQF